MRRCLVPWVLFCALLCVVTAVFASQDIVATDDTPVVILFDRSHSMNDLLNGQPKIQIAKDAFQKLSQRFHGQTQVSVRFFAGGVNKHDDTANCLHSEQSFPMGSKVNATLMGTLVKGLRPLGRKTNIAHAIKLASEDIKGSKNGRIILISDGQENCNLNPISLASELSDKNIKIDTIGIGMPGDFSQLGRIALAGSGEFQLAQSADVLAQAIGRGMPAMKQGAPSSEVNLSQSIPVPNSEVSSETELVRELEPFPVMDPEPLPMPKAPPAVPAPPVIPLELEEEVVSERPKEPVAIEMILDVSGSMAGKIKGQAKMKLAREAMHSSIRGLDSPAFHVGFRAYGFDSSVPKTPEASCPNTVLLNPIAEGQIGSIRGKIDGLQPYGYTPIAKSLELAGNDLVKVKNGKKMIILISDGEETCGGDPIKTAAELRKIGIDVEIHVVGFDLDKKQARQMRAIAHAGGGKYYDARDAKELEQALTSVVEVAQDKIEPTWLRTIHPIEGGATPETAVDLLPGTYTLTRFLEKGEQIFFRVNTKKAQRGVVRGLIQSRRLVRQDGDMVESTSGYSQYRISLYKMRRGKNRGRFVRLSGEPGSFGHVGYSDTTGEGFIFTISSAYDRVHKDALFNIDIVDAGDKLQGSEAPDDLKGEVVSLELNKQITGHLGDGDAVDLYKLGLTASSTEMTLKVTPEDERFRYRVAIKNSKGRRIVSKSSRGGPLNLAIKPDAGEDVIYVELKSSNPKLETRFTSYTLELK